MKKTFEYLKRRGALNLEPKQVEEVLGQLRELNYHDGFHSGRSTIVRNDC